MDLRFFLRGCFPLEEWEGLQHDIFALVYLIPGLSLRDAMGMVRRKRQWWLKRVLQVKKDEDKAARGASGS